jgi:hypothetical protein
MNILLDLLVFLITYYFAAVVQTVMHRVFGHHNRITKIYEIHAKGHHGKYPPQRLLTEQWEDSEQHVMWYYAIPFVPVAAGVAWLLGPWIFAFHVLGMIFAIWWHIHLHKQYHVKGCFWERYRWFRKKRELHFIHHRQVRTNYAIVEYWIDNLLRTRKDPDPGPRVTVDRSWGAAAPRPNNGTGRVSAPCKFHWRADDL